MLGVADPRRHAAGRRHLHRVGAARASPASSFARSIAGICLLPPTMLMGATLPAISRWVKATPDGVVVARLLLRRQHRRRRRRLPARRLLPAARVRRRDRDRSSRVAINVVVARDRARARAAAPTYDADVVIADSRGASAPAGARPVYVAIALSGLTALAAEVVWTRLLSLHFGATVYTFSLILAVFLVGLGIGSTVGATMARNVASPRRALGWCQLLLCGGDGVGGVPAHRVAAVLADQPVHRDDAVVHAAARSRPLPVGRAARRDALGRELSARARRGGVDRAGCRAARRRRLRREHRRRDRRLDGRRASS